MKSVKRNMNFVRIILKWLMVKIWINVYTVVQLQNVYLPTPIETALELFIYLPTYSRVDMVGTNHDKVLTQ